MNMQNLLLSLKCRVISNLFCIPWACKFLIYNYLDKILVEESQSKDIVNIDVFIMYEPRFSRVINEFAKKKINVGFLSRRYFDLIFRCYLGEYLQEGERNYSEYALKTYQKYDGARKQYLRCCQTFARVLKRYSRSKIILLPKFNDDYTLELIQAFHEEGWVVVVYDREGMVTRERLTKIAPVVAEMAPECNFIITYNKTHQEFFNRVFTLAKKSSPEILIFGNPLSDDWFDLDSIVPSNAWPKFARKKVLFFAFGEFSYVYDYEYLKNRDHVWQDLLVDIHCVFKDYFSSENEDWLVYKRGPKGDRDYWAGSEILLSLRNVILVDPLMSANSLIKSADIIIAFQTTAIIDAMHTDVPIIYCGWGVNYSELRGNLINFEEMALNNAIFYADSPEKLKQFLSLPVEELKVNAESRKKYREMYTSNPVGTVAARFVGWMDDTFKLSSDRVRD